MSDLQIQTFGFNKNNSVTQSEIAIHTELSLPEVCLDRVITFKKNFFLISVNVFLCAIASNVYVIKRFHIHILQERLHKAYNYLMLSIRR